MSACAAKRSMASNSELHLETEMRFLRARERRQLADLLDVGDRWKELAASLPKPDGKEGFLLNANNIQTLEQQKHKPGGSPTLQLLEYWGTSGRKRAKIADLIESLSRCKLYQAADYIYIDILHMEPVPREDESEPIEGFQIANSNEENMVQKNNFNQINKRDYGSGNDLPTKLANSCPVSQDENTKTSFRPLTPTAPVQSIESPACDEDMLNLANIAKFSYSELSQASNNFNQLPVAEGGAKLGEGAFGDVFRAKIPSFPKSIAVKRLKSSFEKQFLAELRIMSKFKHENLLSLLGISFDGPYMCLIYEFMQNGSLLDRLMCLNGTLPIPWKQRILIATGTARGICYLHTFSSKPYIHRDIKTANILLNKNFVPQIGDFGLARMGSYGESVTHAVTTTIIGTSVYMSPEAFRGDISVKMDTFSFGVVLLELLTGLMPYDEGREEADLLSFLEEKIEEEGGEISFPNLESFLDVAAGQWNVTLANEMFGIARSCTEQRKKNRPTMVEVNYFYSSKPVFCTFVL